MRRRLREAGLETPDLEARVLLEAAFGAQPPPRHRWDESTAPDPARLDALVARRLAGEPAQRILGQAGFWTLDLALGPETLVPRPETETVVSATLDRLRRERRADQPLSLLDLGTGGGAILLALLSELPRASGVGVDRAQGALRIAAQNARACGLRDRASWREGDWTSDLAGTFDVVLSNPPYVASAEIAGLAVEVREHDPWLALDGGVDGLDAYRAILPALPEVLAPAGFAVLEFGLGQADAIVALGAASGLRTDEVRRDLAGVDRVVVFSVEGPPRG